jgi:hypothetical protein
VPVVRSIESGQRGVALNVRMLTFGDSPGAKKRTRGRSP